MKKAHCFTALLAAGLSGCHATDAPGPGGLVGDWRLTKLVCYCPSAPLPDEVLTLTASRTFQVQRNGRLVAEGSYAVGQGATCGGSTSQPVLDFTLASSQLPFAGTYSMQANTLLIDYGQACDAPFKTYERQ